MAEPSLPTRVYLMLHAGKDTLATAESLTGGRLATMITDVPGVSAVYLGGVVTYATEVKIAMLGVPEGLVAEHGVVSAECAVAMATGVRGLTEASYTLATTGVAGPDEQEGKPVGTVYVGIAGPGFAEAIALNLDGDRPTIQDKACIRALEELAERLSIPRADVRRESGSLG